MNNKENYLRGSAVMADYIVTAEIRLEVEAQDEAEAKQIVMEDISNFLIHNGFADLLKVQEKKTKDKRRK